MSMTSDRSAKAMQQHLMPEAPMPEAPMPVAARVLGWLGVVPFVATAVQVATGWPLSPRMTGPALFALTIYGAVILSFVGGVQWGLAVAATGRHGSDAATSGRRFGVSVLPAFAGWGGLWLAGRPGLLLMAAGFATLLIYDRWTVGRDATPIWYGELRLHLTIAVVACLVAAAAFGPF